MLPFPTGGTFAQQAEQFLAIQDATRWLVILRITQGKYSLSRMRRSLRLKYGAPCMWTAVRPRRILCPCELLGAPVKLISA
jgi:hypothetical protein